MSERYKFGEPEEVYFTTSAIIHWIDLFTPSDYCYLLIDSLKHCVKEKGLVVHAFCIMPSHVHQSTVDKTKAFLNFVSNSANLVNTRRV